MQFLIDERLQGVFLQERLMNLYAIVSLHSNQRIWLIIRILPKEKIQHGQNATNSDGGYVKTSCGFEYTPINKDSFYIHEFSGVV